MPTRKVSLKISLSSQKKCTSKWLQVWFYFDKFASKRCKLIKRRLYRCPKVFTNKITINLHSWKLSKGMHFTFDVVFFLMKKWFFVVSFETDIFCVTQRHDFCNLVDFEFFAIFVARFQQKVDCFLCHQEKRNVNFFIT